MDDTHMPKLNVAQAYWLMKIAVAASAGPLEGYPISKSTFRTLKAKGLVWSVRTYKGQEVAYLTDLGREMAGLLLVVA